MATDCEAMILCAGLGTRLRPLTLELPKPAVPLLNRPLVGYAMSLVRALGLQRVTINTHWLPDGMREAALQEAAREGLELRVSHEPAVLGTGGGLRQARELGLVARDRPLVVLNGDVLFDVDLRRVVRTHLDSGARATMVLRPMPAGGSYSPVEADADGRIRRIGRYGEPGHGPGHLFTGVHVLSPEALDLLPEGEVGVIETVYAPLLERGERVQAAFETGRWLDLGDPPGYLDAHLRLLGEALVASGAHVGEGARIERSCVGEGAFVGEGAEVIDSVVWAGARVEAGERVERTVVTPKVRVRVE